MSNILEFKKSEQPYTQNELLQIIYASYSFILQNSKSERRKNAILSSIRDVLKDTDYDL